MAPLRSFWNGLAQTVIVLYISSLTQALQQAAFVWEGVKSSNSLNDTIVGECDSVQIVVQPLKRGAALNATAPFYMISYELGGISSTDFVGSDPNNLTWVVKHSQGSQVLLDLVDSNGLSGGIGTVIVQSGTSSNCHPTSLTSPIKVSPDLTQISTCDSVTVNITSGQKPLTVSVVPIIVGAVPENFTLGEDDDAFTYVNRVPTGNSFIITAVDSTGQWAWGTNSLSSTGSQDTSCTGKQSFGSHSSNVTSSASSNSSLSHQGIIIGISIAGGIALALAGVLVFFFFRRRRNQQHKFANSYRGGDDLTPFIAPPSMSNIPYSDTPLSSIPPSSYGGSQGSEVPLLRNPHPPERPVFATGMPQESVHGSVYSPSEGTRSDTDGNYTRRQDSLMGKGRALLGEGSSSGRSLPTQSLFIANANTTTGAPLSEKDRLAQLARMREEEHRRAVIQHEDAEDVVEVPPVYKERA